MEQFLIDTGKFIISMPIFGYFFTTVIFCMAFCTHIHILLVAKEPKAQRLALILVGLSVTGILGILYTDIGAAICMAITATTPAR